MRIAVIGCGLIGARRAGVVARTREDCLVAVSDVDASRATALASAHRTDSTTRWHDVVERADVDAVIVSTSNDWLAPISIAALKHGKHVLCEKPLGRTVREAEAIVESARAAGRTLKTGFNHRHHPAIARAHAILREGGIGEPLMVRGRYGHGGRPGYDREWRAFPEISGGGELLDQGIHIIDLARWFLGEFAEVVGFTAQYFWTRGGSVEDNGLALLRTADGRIGSLHASWTQWRNLFSFEIIGRDGILAIDGLGGSYGVERLIWDRRRPESGPPLQETFEFDGPDRSWDDEWSEFTSAVREGREPLGSGTDGLQAMRLIDAVYRSNASRTVIALAAPTAVELVR